MFSRAKPKSVRPATGVSPSILSVDLRITGDLASEGEIQVDGSVDGDVNCHNLSVGKSGHVQGSVYADDALVRGKIDGQIQAKNVTLTKSAIVIGDILHETLTIEPGAHLEGRCQRIEVPPRDGTVSTEPSDSSEGGDTDVSEPDDLDSPERDEFDSLDQDEIDEPIEGVFADHTADHSDGLIDEPKQQIG